MTAMMIAAAQAMRNVCMAFALSPNPIVCFYNKQKSDT
jgi:hypothetical protein